MTNEVLSERDRQILEHLNRAQSLEVTLKEYAEPYLLDVKDLYAYFTDAGLSFHAMSGCDFT